MHGPPSHAGTHVSTGQGRCLMCIASSPGCALNSVHVVPLPTHSCRWSISWLGPIAGERGLAQDSLRRNVATVWRVCGLASPPAVPPVQPRPRALLFGSFSVAGDGDVDSWVRPSYLLSGSVLVEVGFRDKATVISQGLNTALVPICYLDKWLFANVFLGMER